MITFPQNPVVVKARVPVEFPPLLLVVMVLLGMLGITVLGLLSRRRRAGCDPVRPQHAR
jgi:hypothetical protein